MPKTILKLINWFFNRKEKVNKQKKDSTVIIAENVTIININTDKDRKSQSKLS